MGVKNGVIITALVFCGCNSYKAKSPEQEEALGIPEKIEFAFVNARVFQPYCVRCHSEAGGNKGEVNLETYDNIVAKIGDIENTALIEMSMPPKRAGGPLGVYEQNILRLWIDQGALRDAQSMWEGTEI